MSYQLTKKPLPGLTSIEQLELLALADTFASAKLDLEESPGSIERGVKFAKREGRLLDIGHFDFLVIVLKRDAMSPFYVLIVTCTSNMKIKLFSVLQ